MNAAAIASAFRMEGNAVSCNPSGNGHINKTYTVTTGTGHRYILQNINHRVFQDVDALMNNVVAVTNHLRARCADPRRVLTLVPTLDGAFYTLAQDGNYYRMFEFVENSVCLDQAENENDFFQSAVAFGEFQNQLADFPADTLVETIPHFHDTIDRYRQFKEVLRRDPLGRSRDCREDIAFALVREEEGGTLVRMLQDGKLPLRVTHNDTKLNNVMLDRDTRTPLCVIDLDTVMPGLAGNDFGDSIRFGASTAEEDEPDLSKVHLSMPLYTAFTKGFLGACGKSLTPIEIETLPLAAKLITLELGVRFLTDHLQGDTYFSIHRENHNLDRCRTQFKLVSEMEAHWDEMNRVVKDVYEGLA
ncbi:MAG: aminoglycoside phosphotransferase family protein [Clostridia bacterium]|nr:aminoglycoside phosphotransferase family protein [Clostridia bacterium]